MALTQISTQGIKDGTITGSDLTTNIDLVDSQRIRIGTSNDLEIFHNGNFNFIVNNNNKNLAIQAKDGENAIVTIPDAEVQLYHNNSLKFETTSAGATITGALTTNTSGGNAVLGSHLDLGDNQKARFGASDDLQIYHDSINSYIENNTNYFQINSTSAVFIKAGNEHCIDAVHNGAVKLYYDNSKKFETTSAGVTVTGALATTSLSATGGITGTGGNFVLGDSSGTSNNRIKLGASGDLQIYHDGSNSIISEQGTGDLTINATSLNLFNNDIGGAYARFISNGAAELYHAGSKKLHTFDSGVVISGDAQWMDGHDAQFGSSADLKIFHDGTNSVINNTTNDLRIESDRIELNNQASNEFYLTCTANGAVELYHNNSKKFETTSTGITVSGNISIGDGDELRLGDGNDLIIKHDSANTYISNQTGELVLNGDTIRLRKGDGLEDHLKCFANGSVELYQNGTKRFETTSSGINVVGAITVNGSAFTGGKILQVLQTVKTDTFSLSTNDVDTNITGLSVDITPTSTSSKIFVSCTWEHSSDHTNSFAMFFLRRIVSGTTNNICFGDSRGSSIQCTRSHMRVQNLEAKCSNIEFLDSPNTTSQVTYTLALRNAHQGTILVGGTSATDDDNRTSTPSVITVREVSA